MFSAGPNDLAGWVGDEVRCFRLILFKPVSVGLFLVAASCTDDGASRSGPRIDTLQSGVVVVRNSAVGIWNKRSAWQLTDEVRIGTHHGDEPAAFGDVRDIDLDPQGRVWVLDFQAQDIRVFDTNGSYVRTIGRPGGGPGEFRSAAGVRFDPTGRLWVLNQGNQRYSLFDTAGVLLEEFPRRGSIFVTEWTRSIFTANGELLDHVPVRPEPGSVRRFARYDTRRGGFVDTVRSPLLPAGTPVGWGYIMPTRRSSWWVAVASEYRLVELTRDLDTSRVVYRAHELRPLTREQRDSARELSRQLRLRSRGEVEQELPRYQRIFDWLVLDDQDHVWIGMSPESGGVTTFDVFDPDGVYLGAVASPYHAERSPSPVIRGDRIAFVTKDSLDVAFVVVFRIQGRVRR